MSEALKPWTPDQPLQANAIDEQFAARVHVKRREFMAALRIADSEPRLPTMDRAIAFAVREFAAACTADYQKTIARLTHQESYRSLDEESRRLGYPAL